MLKASHRLRKESDYRRVYRLGTRRFSHHLCVTALPRDAGATVSRFGIVISKKISKKAVVRNTLKRQIASVIQEYLRNHALIPPLDAIISPKGGAPEMEFAAIQTELSSLLGLRYNVATRKPYYGTRRNKSTGRGARS